MRLKGKIDLNEERVKCTKYISMSNKWYKSEVDNWGTAHFECTDPVVGSGVDWKMCGKKEWGWMGHCSSLWMTTFYYWLRWMNKRYKSESKNQGQLLWEEKLVWQKETEGKASS